MDLTSTSIVRIRDGAISDKFRSPWEARSAGSLVLVRLSGTAGSGAKERGLDMRYLMLAIVGLLIAVASGRALADLPIVLVEESRLPYEYSQSNYDNSPNNYDNAISNYDNSQSNYDNSPSNYANSSSNYDNGRSGSRRLIYTSNGVSSFAGYYVTASNGTTNFFSPSGERVYYKPQGGRGVYCGDDGSFCGVLAAIDGQISLALIERGSKVLFSSRQMPSTGAPGRQRPSMGALGGQVPNNVCNCKGYAGPGGPCYAGPGGPAYDGPGGPAYSGPGGACYDGPGGPEYNGPGGQAYDGPGGPRYRGPGGPAYDGPGGPAYSGPGGPCYAGPGGPCYSGPGGSGHQCPAVCQ